MAIAWIMAVELVSHVIQSNVKTTWNVWNANRDAVLANNVRMACAFLPSTAAVVRQADVTKGNAALGAGMGAVARSEIVSMRAAARERSVKHATTCEIHARARSAFRAPRHAYSPVDDIRVF